MVHLVVRPAVTIVMTHDSTSIIMCIGDVGLNEHDNSIASVRMSRINRSKMGCKPNHNIFFDELELFAKRLDFNAEQTKL